MSIPKIESYTINDMDLSIEDFRDGKLGHFFPKSQTKRYKCWVNGGGLPDADTIDEARKIIFDWATHCTNENIAKYTELLYKNLDVAHALKTVDQLYNFRIKEN